MSEAARKFDREEAFNLRYGSHRGWQKAVDLIKPTQRTSARVDLRAIVLAGGSRISGEPVDLLALRFFSVPIADQDRAMQTAFLTEQFGTDRIQRTRTCMEGVLRMTLHLLLSSPDYQLD